jgi:hypothetical protein
VKGPWVERKVCIVVKTYPTPARNGVEVSCTAAVTDDAQWIRLFPVPFRFLDQDKRFKKYQWVSMKVRRSSDPRPESFNIDPDSITLLGSEPISTKKNWAERKSLVLPLISKSYCSLKATRDRDGHPTLGLFRPRSIHELVIEKISAVWSAEEQAKLNQKDLFDLGPAQQLEKIPFKFSYRFDCDKAECPGHTFMCSDWEMAQAYRSWRAKYGANWEAEFRKKFETEMKEKDTHFYIGTIHQHPANWIIVGLFYPPK